MTGFWEAVLEQHEAREEEAFEVLEQSGAKVCKVSRGCPFECIAITAPNPRAATAYVDELIHRLDGSGDKEILVIAVSDPEGVRIGSGGGTLNAVLEIDEALRAASLEEGGEDPHSGGLSASKVLLVHSGGDSQRSPTQCVCGKAWSALNSCGNNHSTAIGDESCNTPMDLLLDHLFRLFSAGAELPPGSLVVTACDVMLLIPTSVAASADWSLWSGANSGGASGSVAGLAIAADAGKYAPNHGVYCLAEEGKHGSGVDGDQTCGVMGVSRYLQKPSVEVAEKAGAFLPPHQHQVQSELVHPLQPEVAIDTGVVVFSGKATAALVRMASSEPFKGCTSRGVEEGAAALRLELYSDLLLALRTDATGDEGTGGFEAYIAACGAAVSPDEPLFKARLDIWDALSGFPLGAMLLRGATFVHLGTTPELLDMMTLRLPTFVEPYGLTTRAGCAVGRACSVEDDPPAVIVNSNLQGAGVVAGGSVVEHCLLQGDGWEVGAGCLVSGVRSLRADFRLRLRAGMCIQQTDLGSEEDVVLDEGDGGEDEPDEDEEEGEQNERETGSDGNEDEQQGGDEGEEDEEEEQDEGGDGEDDSKSFVVSIFAVGDDIKAHYTKPTATFCGATWSKFLGYTGATAEDIWGDVPEAARTLWSAKLFPVHTPSEDEGQGTGKCSGNDFAAAVLWVQDVRDTDTDTDTSLPTPPTSMGIDQQYASAALIKSWLSAERLSFKDILRRADPSKEFQWRRRLQKEIASGTNDAGGNGAVCRVSGRWDAITLVARDVLDLQEAQRHLPFLSGKAGTAFCIPPPHPSTTNKPPSARERMEFDGSLVLNAILVVAERFSALKRARFGSETDAAAVRGMRVVLCLGDDNGWGRSVGRVLAQGGSSADDGVWVLQGNGDLFLVGENSVEALVKLCLSDPTYQRFTYLGADNGLQRDETAHTGDECALAYVSAAAAVACTSPPIKHGHICGNTEIPSSSMHHADAPTSSLVEIVRGVFRVLNKLDERAADKGCTVAGVAQALARMACRMFYLAEILGGGGHRSGPGEHADWQAQMRGLDTLRLSPDSAWAPPTSVPTVIYGLKRLRNAWLGHDLAVNDITGGGFEECLTGNVRCLPDPHLLVRCARHYERAAAVVVSAAVATASLFVEPPPLAWLGEDKTVSPDGQAAEYGEQEGEHGALPVGASVTSTAPARIDFAGGWTDTPPISYEAGGSVLNAAVTVSGERPVDARCDRIENRRVELVCEGMDGVVTHTVVCSELEDFSDFCVPQAPAALLKAAIICTGIVTLPQASAAASHPPPPSTQASTVALGSLEEQLCRVFGRGGIRVTSRSRLPQGSGMGTSSILAGVVLSSVCVAAGRAMSRTSLVHAVLHVEQLMTAGGGHQDQVGGLLGGVKITRSAATLPLQVCPEPVLLDPIFEEALNQRLVLVFSGKQRLARDLLQGVVRGWHDRLPATVATVKGLVQNAEEAADACQGEGNLEKLGSCLSTYWEQKKRMAPGAEPPQVKSLLDKLRPLSHGLSVCGAGGGGFVVCITKAPGEEGMAQVAAALAATGSSNEVSSMTLHRGSLDPVGMKVLVDNPTASRASWKPPR